MLALAACDSGPNVAELRDLQDSVSRLNAFEDRIFEIVSLDPPKGTFRVSSLSDLKALTGELATAKFHGCANEASDALLAATSQFIRSQENGTLAQSKAQEEAWRRVEGYCQAQEACEASVPL
jgi:hypothetical protein